MDFGIKGGLTEARAEALTQMALSRHRWDDNMCGLAIFNETLLFLA